MLSAFEARKSMKQSKLPQSVVLSEEDCSTVDKLVGAVEKAIRANCEIGFGNVHFVVVDDDVHLTNVVFTKTVDCISENGYIVRVYSRNRETSGQWNFEIIWTSTLNY